MTLNKDYTAEDLQKALDRGREIGRREALAQPEQEPVAVVDSTISGHIDWLCTFFPKQGTKLYTTPPQRKPLTDDREAFKRYIEECDECAIVPDVAGAFNAGWRAAHGIKGDA